MALSHRGALLHCLVFDWDNFGSDDFLGETIVDLGKYEDERPHSLKLDLADMRAAKQRRGTLYLALQIAPESSIPSARDSARGAAGASRLSSHGR